MSDVAAILKVMPEGADVDLEALKAAIEEAVPGNAFERIEEERKELGADVREIFAEAKGNGFDVKVMRQILRLRKMTPADRAETEYLREEYKKLLGIAE